MLPRAVKILGTSLKTLVRPISNVVLVRNLHPCFEKSIDDSQRVCEMQPIFQRSLVGEGKVNIRALARENGGLFNGKYMVIFLVCAKRVSRGSVEGET